MKNLFAAPRRCLHWAALAGLCLMLPFPVLAAAPLKATFLADYKDWATFTFTENGAKVCYMISRPKKTEGKMAKRGEAALLITNRPAEKSYGVISILGGFTYAKDKDVKVNVGPKNFTLFSKNDTAWASDDATDHAMSEAIRNGSSLTVQSIPAAPANSPPIIDTYSLSGAGAAYKAINDACSVKP